MSEEKSRAAVSEQKVSAEVDLDEIVHCAPEHKACVSPGIRMLTTGVKALLPFPESSAVSVWEDHQLCLRALHTSVELLGSVVLLLL